MHGGDVPGLPIDTVEAIMVKATQSILTQFHHERTRMMDILLAVQHEFGYVPRESLEVIARAL